MLRDFLAGRYGLAKIYWIGFVGFVLIYRMVNVWVTNQYLQELDDQAFAQIELTHNVIAIASFVISVLLAIALVNASFEKWRAGFWGWIASILGVVSVVATGFTAATLLFPSIPQPRFMLERELSELNKQLPGMISPGVTMQNVAIIGDEMVYAITVDGEITEQDKVLILEDFATTGELGAELCGDFAGFFAGGLTAVIYRYTYANEVFDVPVTAQDCAAL